MLKNKCSRTTLVPSLLIAMALYAQSVSAALIELGPEFLTAPDDPIVNFLDRVSARHEPLSPGYTYRAENYSQGGTWQTASGSVSANMSATTSESGSIQQSMQVGVREADGFNWGYAEASAGGTVLFRPDTAPALFPQCRLCSEP